MNVSCIYVTMQLSLLFLCTSYTCCLVSIANNVMTIRVVRESLNGSKSHDKCACLKTTLFLAMLVYEKEGFVLEENLITIDHVQHV